jgi:hypothetical protein
MDRNVSSPGPTKECTGRLPAAGDPYVMRVKVMRTTKFLFLGALGGLTYVFISFFLLNPSMAHHPEVLVGWAMEGFLFALFYLLIRIPFSKVAASMKINIVIGMASGLLSCSPFVAFTYYNAVIRTERANVMVLAELKRNIVSQLGYHALGFMLLGAVVGILISLNKRISS